MHPNAQIQLRASQRHDEWMIALHKGDTIKLGQLAASDDPAAALLELETYINGVYRGSQHPLSRPKAEIESCVKSVVPLIDEIRDRLGSRVREFDLAMLRFIRRSSALSPVLGAGVSMGAHAPSWAELVRLLLEQTLAKGLELYESVPIADSSPTPPVTFLPDGQVRMGSTGTWRFEQRVREVKRYSAEQEAGAREILSTIQTQRGKTDVETLMKGAQICQDLCGQELFRLVTAAIYSQAQAQSETHRAIAKLARAQRVPERGPGWFPGWDAIITYNFDALMSEALAEEKVPHAAWAMKGDELRGDPDEVARTSDWIQPVFHLHGYTPRRFFLITHVRFVFSTSQFLTTYRDQPQSRILKEVMEGYISNPVHIALYIGCSFTDEGMNKLLRDAFERYPGRFHYALLRWPHNGRTVPTKEERKKEAAKYLEIGVRPVWFEDFAELPGLIAQLE
jgi:hypothetical protein